MAAFFAFLWNTLVTAAVEYLSGLAIRALTA